MDATSVRSVEMRYSKKTQCNQKYIHLVVFIARGRNGETKVFFFVADAKLSHE